MSADELPQGDGDCYEAAVYTMLDIARYDQSRFRLVHGIATGQGPIAGIRHGHAWVEDTELCLAIDQSNGHDVAIPLGLYFAIGNINLLESKHYTYQEMLENLLLHDTYGPW